MQNQPLQDAEGLPRRRFLTGAGAAVATFTLAQPGSVFGAPANNKIHIGLSGCGGRGQWILKFFQDHGGYHIAAVSDYFADRANAAGSKYGVPESHRFSGLTGYKRMLEAGIDALVIESPPYFHPEQAAAGVDAGKHVYLAKPVAVDVPGCLSIEASGRKATQKRLAFLVDFQTRNHPAYKKAVQMVHEGKIGQLVSGEATYQCSLYFKNLDEQLRKDPKNPELRLRAWAVDKVLSGDIITEQNIHALDVASWILNTEPVKAYGACAKTRPYVGDCHDHFACVFYYPSDFLLSFSSKQVGRFWDDIQCRIYGTEGVIDTHYGGPVKVECDDKYNGGLTSNIYAEGVVNNVADFHKAITTGDFSNPTVAPSVRSNLVTILGRMAAYRRAEVTWAEMLRQAEAWQFDLKGLKA